jgi:TetR/AcrR family transcriptional regulator
MARRITLRALQGETARYGKPETGREAAILEAATRLFGEKGYKGTPTAKIAAEAGVTERTLFRYFPTKEALYKRVMFPALMSAAIPTELADTGKLFATDSESFPEWHRRILKLRLDVVRKAAPQFRLLLSTLLSDDGVRKNTIELWRSNLWNQAIEAVKRYQKRGHVRSDLSAESIARAVISLNVSYIMARALIAPDAKWGDEDEAIAATVEILLNGVAPRPR